VAEEKENITTKGTNITKFLIIILNSLVTFTASFKIR